jgi:hypothetical protein
MEKFARNTKYRIGKVMDMLTWAILALSVLLSFAGTAVVCSTIQRHNRQQARRELFGLSPLIGP